MTRATRCVGAAVAALLPTSGCHAAHQVGTNVAMAPAWPQWLAGRQLHAETPDYVLYARAPRVAERLKRWLDEELSTFRDWYVFTPKGPGLVLAIEPGEEPSAPAAKWCGEQARPLRDHPYSFRRHPYFRESFDMPVNDAVTIGLLDERVPAPAWICFLTTDEHLGAVFEAKLTVLRKEWLADLKAMPPDVWAANRWVIPLFYVGAELSFPRFRSIDVELMHLQRRETLWSALMRCVIEDESLREAEMDAVREEIDVEWQRIWDSRPMG